MTQQFNTLFKTICSYKIKSVKSTNKGNNSCSYFCWFKKGPSLSVSIFTLCICLSYSITCFLYKNNINIQTNDDLISKLNKKYFTTIDIPIVTKCIRGSCYFCCMFVSVDVKMYTKRRFLIKMSQKRQMWQGICQRLG